MAPHLTFAFETSCDETAAAVVEDGCRIRSNVIASQADLHRAFGGVVPELASRRHLEKLLPVAETALHEAGIGWGEIDLVAATRGPGLIGALLVGFSAAKGLALALDRPFVGVNHLAGHLYAHLLTEPRPDWPAVCLVVSGGHTELLYVDAAGAVEVLGRTRDDAAGEAFDKVARLLGLPYPGGPAIDRLAAAGNPEAIPLPRAWLGESYDFSFSGLKTAVALALERSGAELRAADVAASFQAAAVEVLVAKTVRAARARGVTRILVAGGVAANRGLRRALQAAAEREGLALFVPPPILCTDNAAMIAAAGYHRWRVEGPDPLDLDVFSRLPDEPYGALHR